MYYAGVAAEHWLSRFSWVAMLIAVLGGLVATIALRGRIGAQIAEMNARYQEPDPVE